jgi:hypothetical protein
VYFGRFACARKKGVLSSGYALLSTPPAHPKRRGNAGAEGSYPRATPYCLRLPRIQSAGETRVQGGLFLGQRTRRYAPALAAYYLRIPRFHGCGALGCAGGVDSSSSCGAKRAQHCRKKTPFFAGHSNRPNRTICLYPPSYLFSGPHSIVQSASKSCIMQP